MPVYIEHNVKNEYTKIIEVLKYLIYDIEIPFEDITFQTRYKPKSNDINTKLNSNEYNGSNDVKLFLDNCK